MTEKQTPEESFRLVAEDRAQVQAEAAASTGWMRESMLARIAI